MENKLSGPLCVIGLGYVGLPLAKEFAKQRQVIGYDLNPNRVASIRSDKDINELNLKLTSDEHDLRNCTTWIVAVPTPVDSAKSPDLSSVIEATKTISKFLTHGNLVVFESTVYPGATEEVCLPLLESGSGLKVASDFYLGYSPERINPGDVDRSIADIVKVTSGYDHESSRLVDELYSSIITAGTFRAKGIKEAEAAKVIENTQRDLNVALINEFAIVCDRMGISVYDVLDAARTKWNFLDFKPGLVGGHCIGVDPYYLTYKAEQLGYHPELILAGRRLNDYMGIYIANKFAKHMLALSLNTSDQRVLILGYAFKENCDDPRNSKVTDVCKELSEFGFSLDVFDPWIDIAKMSLELDSQINFVEYIQEKRYDGILIAVGHECFKKLGAQEIRKALRIPNGVFFDLKNIFPFEQDLLRL